MIFLLKHFETTLNGRYRKSEWKFYAIKMELGNFDKIILVEQIEFENIGL